LIQAFCLLREAEQELELARKWYDEQRYGLGLVFFDAFEVAVQYAQDFPGAGAALSDPMFVSSVRRFPLRGFPFHIVTTVEDDGLVVIAVAHAKRKPEYWLERVK